MKLQNSTLLMAGCFYCAVLLSPFALAQADKSQLAACFAIAENNARLACYDTLARPGQAAAATVSPTPAQPTAPTAAPSVQAASVTSAAPAAIAKAAPAAPELAPKESFGKQVPRSEQVEEVLVDKVAAIKEVEPKKMQITLANGQVWKQSIGKSFMLRPNDTVRITGSPWGDSFRLEKDGKPGYIQVQRLR